MEGLTALFSLRKVIISTVLVLLIGLTTGVFFRDQLIKLFSQISGSKPNPTVLLVSASQLNNQNTIESTGAVIYKVTLDKKAVDEGAKTAKVESLALGLNPSLSLDNKLLAFSKYDQDSKEIQIFQVNINGADIKRLTSSPGQKWNPNWSPDGKKLIVTKLDVGTRDVSLFMLDLATGKEFPLNHGFKGSQFTSWLPDSSGYVFIGSQDNKTHLMLSKDNKDQDISPSENGTLVTDISYPSVSPDGKKIVFARLISGYGQLYQLNIDGSGLKTLSNNKNLTFSSPSWSPDGKYLVSIALSNKEKKSFMEIISPEGKILNQISIDGKTGFNMPHILNP